jgi:hypothetical protein
LREELSGQVEVAAHRFERGLIDLGVRPDERVVNRVIVESRRERDSLFDRERAEVRAHHQPGDALCPFRPQVAALGVLERLPPGLIGLTH